MQPSAIHDTAPVPIPKPALALGLAGLIPFAACALSAWSSNASLAGGSLFAAGAYGAVILSFLGGVRWGAALCAPFDAAGGVSWKSLGWSVVPSLVAWPALLLPATPQLTVLIVGFGVQFWRDRQATEAGLLPGWFGRLRLYLTLGAVTWLGITLLASVL